MTRRGNVRTPTALDSARRTRYALRPRAGARRTLYGAALAFAALLSVSLGPAGAQMAGDERALELGRGFEISGSIGLIYPISDLTRDPDSFGTTLKTNVGLGLEGIYWTSRNWGFGVTGLYSPTELQVVATDFQGAVPNDLGNATYFAGAVNVFYRLPGTGSSSGLEPFFALGAGLRHLNVDAIAQPEVESSTDPVGTIAGGVRVAELVSGVVVRLELRDHFGWFESPTTGETKLQNEILGSVGFGIRFR